MLLKDLSSLLQRTRSTHTTANTRAQQTFATWQLACSPWQGAEEEPDLWQRGQEHCHQRAGLSLQHFGSTGAPINTQLKFRTDVRRLTVSHCFLSQGHSLLQTFTLICLFNFSLPIKALAGRSSERLYLLPPTLQMKAPSTSYLACNHFPDKGGGEMMAGGQPGSDSFSWSRRS